MIDLDPRKTAAVATAVRIRNTALTDDASNKKASAAIRKDANAIDGLAFPRRQRLAMRGDRPAIALYETFPQDGRPSATVRDAAAKARDAITDTVIAHCESDGYAPFDN